MKSKFIFPIAAAVLLFLTPVLVEAHCPLCTLAVGAAALTAKYYGFDASVIGIFVGGLGISIGLWIARALKKEYVKFQTALIVLASFLLTVIPLLWTIPDTMYVPLFLFGAIGTAFNKVYWINKLLFGSVLGGVASVAGFWMHTTIKKKRGSVLFPYQGVALTVGLLLIAAVLDYFLIAWI